jgi:fibronectin type 3 domain-containing protein
MKWQPFRFTRLRKSHHARCLPIKCQNLPRLEELETRVVPATNVTAYHQASPVPNPPSTIGAGVNSNETILTPANVNSTDFGKLFSTTVDGQVYAEPLYVENVNITTGANQGTHNVVFVATENDSLYAIDSGSGVILWHDALLTAAHGGTVTAVPNSAVNSGDISPEIGITATPVIDTTTNTIFVESKQQEVASDGTHFEHYLYAVNIASGAMSNQVLIADSIGDTVVSGPQVAGTGAGSANGVVKFDALRQLDRPALTLINGNIYLAYASHGDNGPYHGWILGYSESSLAATAVFNVNPNGNDDGIWQSGGALAYETVNGNTFIYFETGNGSFDTTLTQSPFNANLMIPSKGDYGDSFVKVEIDGSTPAAGSLDATNNINGWGMHVADYFTPMNEGNLSGGDTDLGSGAPLLLPASAGSAAHPNLLVGAGKEGRIYLIDRNNMGGYHGDAGGDGNSGTDNVVQETVAGAINGSLDTPTYYNGSLYYVGGYGDEARTFTISNAVMSSTSVTQSTDSYGFPGSTATISTNPSGGNAVVWDIGGPGTNQLRAYNAADGYSAEIYTSAQAANSRDTLGNAEKFAVPTVADGEVFVGTTNALVAYGLLTHSTAPPAAPTNLSASAFSGNVIQLSWTDNDTAPNSATGYNILESTNGTTFTQVGTASAGATAFAVGGLQLSTTYYFEIDAFNPVGTSALSNVASATTTNQPSTIDFSSGFANSGGVLTYNGSAKINGTSAELTDGGGGEAGSVFSTNPVSVASFTTQFTFQLTNANADGFTFTIQGNGPTALGGAGGSLGYAGMGNSVAVKFDLFNNAGEGIDSTGEYTDGAAPTVPAIDLTNTGINLHSGDVFQVTMTYSGTTLNVSVTDTKTNASASQSYTVNIPQVIGGTTGYVGFTGGTGGTTVVQNILTWVYSPTATTPPAAPTNLNGNVVSGSEIDLSWTNNANNATAILVDRSSDGTHFTQIASISGTATTYQDTSLSPGNTYYYEVQATNAAGNSAFSNVISASTVVPPTPPIDLVATNITTTEVDLSWVNVATNATGIKILQQLGSNSSRVVASGLPPTTNSYNIAGLTPGSPYLFEVDALNSNGPSGATIISVDTLPTAVTGVAATGGTGITISWSADQGAIDYNVYRTTIAGSEGTTPTWTGIAGTSYVDATAAPGTTYYYTVTAVDPDSASPTNPAGETPQSAEVSAAAQSAGSTGVNAPTGLVATSQDGPQVQLTWTTNSTAETGFGIERASDAAFSQNVTLIAVPITSGITAAYVDTSVVPGNNYYYRVQTVSGATETAFSNPVAVDIPTAPATPTNGHATHVTATSIDLVWTNNATNAEDYQIDREVVGGAFVLIATLPGNATSYNDTGLTPGTNYDYHIYAVNISGFNDQTGANLYAVSPAIGNLSASTASGQLVLTWSAPAGASDMTYNVYRGTSAGGEGETPIATGLTTTSFTDTSATTGTTYYYEVTSVDPQSLAAPSVAPFGESARSNEVSAVAPVRNVLLLGIAAGGSAAGSFVADTDVNGGGVSGGTGAAISTSGVTNPPPQSVLQHGRIGNFTYTIPNLTPGNTYTVRLDFVEYYFHTAGSRVFNVSINGTEVLNNFDIFAAAGGADILLPESYTATASSSGTITIAFNSVVNNSIVNGIEIYSAAQSAPAAPTGLAATAGNSQVALSWTAVVGATGYDIYRGTSSGGETPLAAGTNVAANSFTDTSAVNGTQYFYYVTALSSAGQSGASIEVSATPQAPTLGAPTGLAGMAGNNQVVLTWNAVSGAAGYDVYRGNNSGAETLLAAGTNIATTTFTDASAVNGTQYFYYVTAVNGSVQSAHSNEVSATPQPPTTNGLILAISAGGPAAGSFAADMDFTGGAVGGGTGATINTSGITNRPPQSVLQHSRIGNSTYTIPGLIAGDSYTVRLDFDEYYWSTAGSRAFNVSVNGVQVLSNFDIFATAGGKNIAIAESFATTASASGTIAIAFTTVVNNAQVDGIEIYASGSTPVPPSPPAGLTATAGNNQVALSWSAVPGATGYDVYRGTASGGETLLASGNNIGTSSFTDTSAVNGTQYFYYVTALNGSLQSARSSEVSALPQVPITGSLVLAISTGGPAAGSFAADADFTGGSVGGATGAAISTSAMSNPPPQSVLQHSRIGNFIYTIPGLTAGASYTVRLDFAENYWSSPGARLFNVSINGTQVLGNFDIYAAAGGKDIGIGEAFPVTAAAGGTITIACTTVVDNARVNGIEIYSAGAQPAAVRTVPLAAGVSSRPAAPATTVPAVSARADTAVATMRGSRLRALDTFLVEWGGDWLTDLAAKRRDRAN